MRHDRIVWHEADDEASWANAAATLVAEALAATLAAADAARLLVSGGTTPAPVHRALASMPLEWNRVVVGLVDDRDVPPDDEGSNARLTRETLLIDRAASARFETLRLSDTPALSAYEANERWRRGEPAIAAAVLGMGDDGHTASLFPGAAGLDAALASIEPYVALDASGCAGAGRYPHRITLTPAGLAAAKTRVLLLRGDAKRAVLERALEAGDVRTLPIRAAIDLPGAPLHVYWCR